MSALRRTSHKPCRRMQRQHSRAAPVTMGFVHQMPPNRKAPALSHGGFNILNRPLQGCRSTISCQVWSWLLYRCRHRLRPEQPAAAHRLQLRHHRQDRHRLRTAEHHRRPGRSDVRERRQLFRSLPCRRRSGRCHPVHGQGIRRCRYHPEQQPELLFVLMHPQQMTLQRLRLVRKSFSSGPNSQNYLCSQFL